MSYKIRLAAMSRLIRWVACSQLHTHPRSRSLHTTSGAWHQEHNDPIKYSSTKAINFRAFESFTNKQPANRPWYQGLSMVLSTTVFLIYFCILREENDMDDHIGSSLYERIPGLEKQQLMVRIEYDKMHGNDTKLLEERLRVVEIENSEKTAAADSGSRQPTPKGAR